MTLSATLEPLFKSGDRNRGSSYHHRGAVYSMRVDDGFVIAEVDGSDCFYEVTLDVRFSNTSLFMVVLQKVKRALVFMAKVQHQKSPNENRFRLGNQSCSEPRPRICETNSSAPFKSPPANFPKPITLLIPAKVCITSRRRFSCQF